MMAITTKSSISVKPRFGGVRIGSSGGDDEDDGIGTIGLRAGSRRGRVGGTGPGAPSAPGLSPGLLGRRGRLLGVAEVDELLLGDDRLALPRGDHLGGTP